MKYRNIPVFIEAIEFKGYNIKEIMKFCPDAYQSDQVIHGIFIPTPRKVEIASVGDMIIKNETGDFFVSDPFKFKDCYEPV